jgi:hypothetical protein
MSDCLIVWKDPKGFPSAFPAWDRNDGLLVDLRDYEGRFVEKWLKDAGVPQPVIDSARDSKPQGYAHIKR